MLYGTDISGWQAATPNLTGNAFVVVKATEGAGYTNPSHGSQVNTARSTGRLVGHYHFAGGGDPAAEARYFVAATGRRPGEILALDLEAPFWGKTGDPVGWACTFARTVHSLTGVWPLFYMNSTDKARYNWAPAVALGVGLWLAQYNATHDAPAPWPFVAMWQYADRNVSSGGDSDVFYGDAAAWGRYGGLGAPAPAAAPPAPKPRPPAPRPPAPRPANPARLIRVEAGDNLSAIAVQFGTTVPHLVAMNGIADPNKIYPGQLLRY